jgi:hypothetical protein
VTISLAGVITDALSVAPPVLFTQNSVALGAEECSAAVAHGGARAIVLSGKQQRP